VIRDHIGMDSATSSPIRINRLPGLVVNGEFYLPRPLYGELLCTAAGLVILWLVAAAMEPAEESLNLC
jgi:hypothetical protein